MSTLSPGIGDALTNDVPCVKCGYSLRGLSPASRCPECGTPVDRSLRGDLLVYSDPDYVSTLRRGVTLVMASIILILVMVIGAMALGMTGAGTGAATLINFIGLGVSACFLAGWWFLTTPDAGQLTTNKGQKPRKIVRVCVGIAAVTKVISTILPMATTFDPAALGLVSLIDMLVTFVGFFAGMLYLRWLAPRIPDERVFKRAKTLMILLSIVVGLYLLTAVVGVLMFMGLMAGNAAGAGGATAAPAPGLAAAAPMIVGGCAAALLGLVALVMYYNLFSWLRKDLARVLADQQA